MAYQNTGLLYVFKDLPKLQTIMSLEEEIIDATGIELACFGFNDSGMKSLQKCGVDGCDDKALIYRGRIIHPCQGRNYEAIAASDLSKDVRALLLRVRAQIKLCDEHMLDMLCQFDTTNLRYTSMWMEAEQIATVTDLSAYKKMRGVR